ncbi:MAG: lysine--tRNA ligase [Candidatus Bathyarchaeota archaeon]|nr:lysine--tRNA ligase [Candidatus Bathyarchaeota archaeon]
MDEEIIGRGTWYDKMAQNIIGREKTLKRSLEMLRTEMGLGASGFPHIGSLGDAVRSYAVTLALKDQGYRSELIAFCDDKDGLRKVPAGLPKSLEKYLGFPVTDIPDPFGCHDSYGRHMSFLLLDAMDKCGIEYRYISAKDAYERGMLINEIRTLLTNAKTVGEIVKEEVGQERYTEVLPYFPVCENCGRIYTTKAVEYLPKEDKVLYVCEGMEIRGRWIDGCRHKGEVDIKTGRGKLSWKGEFAARWKALDIRFEAYGKDIADSVKVNDRICREVLGFEPPSHARYEMFLDKSGRKISKSAGNVFTPQVWFRYGSPQSLMLLLLKRFVGTRTIDVTDIPAYMNEIDYLEEIYFGSKKVSDKRELAKLRGLYEYCWCLKPPKEPSVHVPYNLLTFLAKIAPEGKAVDFIIEKLREYGYLKKDQDADDNIKKRIEYALNWVRDFEEIKETVIGLKPDEERALIDLIEVLRIEEQAEKIQGEIFNTARKHGIPPPDLFKKLYMILLGAPQGPRLGPYIIAMGKQNVIKALERVVKSQKAAENQPI